jgi:hypothetical protein
MSLVLRQRLVYLVADFAGVSVEDDLVVLIIATVEGAHHSCPDGVTAK